MQKRIYLLTILLASIFIYRTVFSGETGHYINGIEGIKGATMPPTGIYYRMYNVLYQSSSLMNEDRKKLDLDFKLNVFANAHRFTWVSDYHLLGGQYALNAIIPLINTNIEIKKAGIDKSKFGLSDICLEPILLGWHGDNYDFSTAFGIFFPTGNFDKDDPSSPGKGFWTGLFSFGGTYYFDTQKTWSVSILPRYETHSKKKYVDVKPGDDFHFEWGIGKTIPSNIIWDFGLAGYCHWQVTDDTGNDVVWDKNIHDSVYGIGPEIDAVIPNLKLQIALRSVFEFNAKDRSEGNIFTFAFSKIF
ncbi:MAG: transporter [Desulfobacterales bacterium]|nr:transporter [Desulfobacterales bacterium]MBF0397671.1 transporter [Desulfobacterales bacterium]